MSFDLLKVDSDVKEDSGDTLPPKGSKFEPVDTNVYPMTIKLAYFSESRGGATALNLVFKAADGTGPEVKQTIYVTSGTAKGKKNFYTDAKGNKRLLPGMALADQLHLLTAEAHLAEADVEKKVIKLWNFDEGAEVNTEVNAIMSLIGKPVMVGLVKKRQNKRVQDANDQWVDGPEPNEFNEVEKFFDTDGRTLTERNADGEADFIKDWKERFPITHVHDTFKELPNSPVTKTNGNAEPQKEVKSLF